MHCDQEHRHVVDQATTKFEYLSHSPEQTVSTGICLGELVQPGDVICLSGDLGAGKTAFTRGVGAGWQAQGSITSPTFTLIHEHRRARDHHVLYHVDCYRLANHTDGWDIGLEEILFGDGIVVIEWPENIAGILPEDCMWIRFDFAGDTQRHLTMVATGERYELLLRAVKIGLIAANRQT
jgi:tRNA threonylcarbamoyladenosine biosynthesis protein TsaE